MEIAEVFRAKYRVNARVAFRLAHCWSQRQVAEEWNLHWPDKPKTLKNFSYWEVWPSSTGHEPSLDVLSKLAQLYQCRVADLLCDLADYRHLDTTAGPPRTALPAGQSSAGLIVPDDSSLWAALSDLRLPDEVAVLLMRHLDALTPADREVLTTPRERDRTYHNLAGVGRAPLVITGEGADGHPPAAPYDRVIATCSVQTVPYPWVAQTRPGGVILTPWGSTFENSALLRLTVDDDGLRAVGEIVDWATFMRLRAQRPIIPDEPDDFDTIAQRRSTDVDLADFLGDDARFGIGLHLPDCRLTWELGEDGYLDTLWLLAPGSWASVRDTVVRQAGARCLWDEARATSCSLYVQVRSQRVAGRRMRVLLSRSPQPCSRGGPPAPAQGSI